MPLSALELHAAARANHGDDVVKVEGPDRKLAPMKDPEYPTSSVLTYWWVAYHVPQDSFTGDTRDSRMVIPDNRAFRETTWHRSSDAGRKKHWAYNAKAFLPTRDTSRVEWTPGVPQLQMKQASNAMLEVTFHSVTPNLKTYVVRTDGGDWQAVDGKRFRWQLNPGENRLEIRTRNKFDVSGPTVTATVTYIPDTGHGDD